MTDETIRPAAARRGMNVDAISAQLGLAVIIFIFWIILRILAPGFLSSFNLFTVGRALAIDIVIGFAQMVVLATGGMIATGYIPSVVASKSLRTLGDKRIKFVGIDDDPIVLDAIKDGFVAGTMAQNPYGQGYIGAYVLDLIASGTCTVNAGAPWIKTPQTAHFIDSGTLVISAANLASYKDDLKKVTADIQGKFKATYLTCK